MTKDKLIEKRRRTKRPYSSVNHTTGDIAYNISQFNRAMGSDGLGHSTCAEAGEGVGLTEAKRYVRRYYIRPQNIFCSNKAEIIKTLIELDDNNCSVYTLNNLGDEKDVSKLMNSDIIYYYDDGILYDKNKVKVMDYDLSIKKEEERKHFANVDDTSDKEFKDEYSDRMTDVTELEESSDINELNLEFDDVNVYGENLTEAAKLCCNHCGEPVGATSYDSEKGILCGGCYQHTIGLEG